MGRGWKIILPIKITLIQVDLLLSVSIVLQGIEEPERK